MAFFITGAEGLVLACGLGPVAALTVPRTVIHYRAASSPSLITEDENKKTIAYCDGFLFSQGRKDLRTQRVRRAGATVYLIYRTLL